MGALLVALAGSTAVAAPGPRPADGRVSDRVVRAWRAAGAEVRWVTTSGLWADAPTPGCRVGFRFHGWLPGRFDGLPAPDAPFHLDVSFPWPGDDAAGVAHDITDAGLKELVRFQNLRALGVFSRTVSDAGADQIARLEGLECLGLSCTKVTAAGLRAVAKLRSVRRLSLGQTDVTEAMFGVIAEFEGLARLDLSFLESPVTADGMGHVARLPRLQKLGLFGADVSDAAAEALGRSKSLRDVDFLNTGVTEAGAAALRKLLPGCDVSARTVDRSFPPPPLPAR